MSRRRLPALSRWALSALFAGLVATGCTGYSGSKAQQVSQWASQYTVTANDQTVLSDVTGLRRSQAAGRLRDLTSNCAALVSDAGTAYGNLPTPDTGLTNELSEAYTSFADGGSTCAGVTSLGSPRLKGALRTIAAGVSELARATRMLAGFGVR